MLKRLRWQLTALYSLAALVLVVSVTFGSYSLLRYYFQYTTDLALQYKMAEAFQKYGLPIPHDLTNAQENWLASGSLSPLEIVYRIDGTSPHAKKNPEEDAEGKQNGEYYDGQLASVFILPLSSGGENLSTTDAPNPPIQPVIDAISTAQLKGTDWRTVNLTNGTRLRLFTYRTGTADGPALFQVGRLLDDHDRVLGLFLAGLGILGTGVFVFLSLGGWLLSGRTIGPAQKAWDQQQVFVSNASHELRTPLTLLRATAELHLRLPEENPSAEGFKSIINECDYMNQLVDDLLLLSRLDSHRLVFERKPLPLAAFLREVQEQVLPLAEKKGLSLTLGKTDGTILADPTRIRQVMLILIDNALRYTPAGGKIQLEASQHGKHLTISVTDNGIGVPAKHLPHLFERFYQVPQENFAEEKKNGLGLSIAKGLVEAQGGKIEFKSREGKGSQVQLIFSSMHL